MIPESQFAEWKDTNSTIQKKMATEDSCATCYYFRLRFADKKDGTCNLKKENRKAYNICQYHTFVNTLK